MCLPCRPFSNQKAIPNKIFFIILILFHATTHIKTKDDINKTFKTIMKANKAYICVRNNMEYNKCTDNHTIILRYLTGMMKNQFKKSICFIFYILRYYNCAFIRACLHPFTKAG